jgi:hypothetical protein
VHSRCEVKVGQRYRHSDKKDHGRNVVEENNGGGMRVGEEVRVREHKGIHDDVDL